MQLFARNSGIIYLLMLVYIKYFMNSMSIFPIGLSAVDFICAFKRRKFFYDIIYLYQY